MARAQSTTVGYLLSVAVATLLVVGLVAGVGTFVESEQRAAVDDQLRVVADRLAAQAVAVDTLARRNGGTAYTEPDLPARVVGSTYRVALVVEGGDTLVRVSTADPAVTVTVPVAVGVPVTESGTTGGDLALCYDDVDGDGESELYVGGRR
ncbi:DUF7266 family protein [Halosegnis marinus]|uniref:Uncharacterized protein n=1 Tax=Halosegnis marinus TaxID=3034023 RepID=A0ABD5ZML3_9EURY|nr:hypothetical protein [Halosegnis sp. DT85]